MIEWVGCGLDETVSVWIWSSGPVRLIEEVAGEAVLKDMFTWFDDIGVIRGSDTSRLVVASGLG